MSGEKEKKELPTDIISAVFGKKRAIIYRPELRAITGSVTGIILLSQMVYWWNKNHKKKFYKFKEECSHKKYKKGDSWCEELGFSVKEFDTAIKQIGFKLGKTKNRIKKEDALIIYYRDSDMVSWYMLNEELLSKCLLARYQEDNKMSDSNSSTEKTSEITNKDTSYRSSKIKNFAPPVCKNFLPEDSEEEVKRVYSKNINVSKILRKFAEQTDTAPIEKWDRTAAYNMSRSKFYKGVDNALRIIDDYFKEKERDGPNVRYLPRASSVSKFKDKILYIIEYFKINRKYNLIDGVAYKNNELPKYLRKERMTFDEMEERFKEAGGGPIPLW